MVIDVVGGEADWRRIYKLCISFINPRPIALVSTVSPEGVTNVAPFSFYNMVCPNPPTVIFCPGLRRDGSAKDTLRNVEALGEFAIATVVPAIARAMADCAADLPYGRSEYDFAGLKPMPATHIRPPLVEQSPINIECRLSQIVKLGAGPGTSSVVFGEIAAIHVADELLDESGMVCDPHKLQTVGRLGGAYYADVTEPYELLIPKVDRQTGERQ